MRAGLGVELVVFVAAVLSLTVGFADVTSGQRAFELVAPEDDVVRIVTWNVGSSLEEGGAALEDEALDHVAAVIRELDADWVFLQEVDSRRQLRDLRERLGARWEGKSSRSSGRRIAALARDGVLDAVRSRERSLTVRIRSHDVLLIAVHADAFSATERNELLGESADQLADNSSRGILLGDFNLDLDLDKRRELFSDDEYLDVETYNYVAKRLRDATVGTGSTAEPDRRLDYIFVDPRAFEVVRSGPFRGRRVRSMDHDPVVCDLRLR